MCAYYIVTQPGEILQVWARFVNGQIKVALLRKLLLCPYCLGGQIMFWTSLYFVLTGSEWYYFFSVPVVIVFIHQFIKINES
jgi:hypothetical protein